MPGFVREVLGRSDYAIISDLVEPNTKVLDLGCGDGKAAALAGREQGRRGARHRDQRRPGAARHQHGVSVYQGDIDEGLTNYPDGAFDYVILSQTLQETRHPLQVLREMLRVGRKAIVAFPNFGHWSVRLAHLFSGRAPKTKLFPHDWYDSPNIHFLTVKDFEELAKREGWTVEREIFLSGRTLGNLLPNLMAAVAVFQVRR